MNGRRWRSEIRRRRRPRLHEERNADSTALTGDGASGHASARVPSDTGRTVRYTRPRQPLCELLGQRARVCARLYRGAVRGLSARPAQEAAALHIL